MLYDTSDLISRDSSIHCSPSLTCLTRLSQDTLRDCDQESTCYNTVISPIYFVSFVLTAQFVLVNVVIAVLMKHLEESNKEAKEEAELEAELELEMKTLSPQPRSPLGSPFLWPGVEGPDSPDSPKPGAPLAVAHAGAASHFSLEHPTVSTHPPLQRGVWGWRWVGVGPAARWVGGMQGGPHSRPKGLDPSAAPAWMWRGQQSLTCPQRWLPTLTAQGHPSKPPVLAHPSPLPLAWPGLPFLALRFKAKFSVSFLFFSYPCPIAKPLSFPPST